MENRTILGVAALVLSLILGAYLLYDPSYGEISDQGYAYSKALLMACNQKDKDRLAEIAALMQSDLESGKLQATETKWLQQIVDLGMQDQWQKANQQARQLMNDQVKAAK